MRLLLAFLLVASTAQAERARDLGVPFEGTPGKLNAITDVPGVEVGQATLIQGDNVRTGVTMVFPRGRANPEAVYGGFFDLNGNGEMTGLSYLQDFGVVQGPIGITNTNAIGDVYAGIQRWTQTKFGEATWPVVAETWDGVLNDLGGFHVTPETAIAAIEAAKPGAIEEGNVGGGTGMVCFGFKGGIGTASRIAHAGNRPYTVGVLVQCNTGDRKVLRIAGAPVGAELARRYLPCEAGKCATEPPPDQGSIIIVVATDAPLIPKQLDRIAKRAAMGLARLGSYSGDESGDLIVAVSNGTPNANHPDQKAPSPIPLIASRDLDPLFEATVEATEEAIVNALVAARTMTGIAGARVTALPHDELKRILKKYRR
ncbi:MAG TPA: P1 family peptidase [Rhizomicrobium sp.]|nr:P1 family peptidase [Rhizomicrobium sp.]